MFYMASHYKYLLRYFKVMFTIRFSCYDTIACIITNQLNTKSGFIKHRHMAKQMDFLPKKEEIEGLKNICVNFRKNPF